MGGTRFIPREFGILKDNLEIIFSTRADNNIELQMGNYGTIELTPPCYKRLSEILSDEYMRYLDAKKVS